MIHTPAGLKTRPTQARLRQALFNSIQFEIPEARVLDLFAGSGSLGFEALSRGAASVVFVESARPVCKLIEKNAAELKVSDRIELVEGAVLERVERMLQRGPFGIVLADPPYAEGWELKLLRELPWDRLLTPGGHFCLEWGTQKSVVAELPDSIGLLVKVREKNYGDSVLSTYQRPET